MLNDEQECCIITVNMQDRRRNLFLDILHITLHYFLLNYMLNHMKAVNRPSLTVVKATGHKGPVQKGIPVLIYINFY